ncbi:MAG TPA: hypothetical protein VHN14_06820 [Kofleriaceae bacterium]|jgi:hypothetical protein|nr:hypothetical protein [Kofleriaceae bacterium]
MIADPLAPLVAGGAFDPNITALLAAFHRADVAVQPVLIGAEVPALAWQPGEGPLVLDGAARMPRAMFLRHDVFGSPSGPDSQTAANAMAWTAALVGWLLVSPAVRTTNRSMWSSLNNKPAALVLASQVGLRLPATLVTNHRAAAEAFLAGHGKIAKPVAGGDLARPLDEAMAMATHRAGPFAAPAIIQEQLVPPEVRVYVIGDQTFAFEVRSRHLDYRAANDAEVIALDAAPQGIAAPLLRLAGAMELDFCAADFKAASDGSLRFLEVNTSPMFARFDEACGGRLCDALVTWLCA